MQDCCLLTQTTTFYTHPHTDLTHAHTCTHFPAARAPILFIHIPRTLYSSFFFFFFNFICLFMAVLGLSFCARAFSSCGKRGPLFIAVCGPLTIVASLVAEHRLQTRRLSNCGSWAQLLRDMWDLSRPLGICTGRQILNHCVTREARTLYSYKETQTQPQG